MESVIQRVSFTCLCDVLLPFCHYPGLPVVVMGTSGSSPTAYQPVVPSWSPVLYCQRLGHRVCHRVVEKKERSYLVRLLVWRATCPGTSEM